MTSFSVKFLGCKVSQADAMLARKALLEAGHEEAPAESAKLHVINTCCITREAEAKSRQAVRRSLKGAPSRQVVVSGCAANLNAGQFCQIAPEVEALKGRAEEVAEAIAGLAGMGCHDYGPAQAAGPPLGESRRRGFVKVQDGCDCNCSYCIIPKVRGSARSRPASEVIAEVERRALQGQPEIVITGISVGGYRCPERGWDLGRLMVEVAAADFVERVRLSSIEVIHVTRSLIEAIASEAKICPHLHIPLQSGDDCVLEMMGRNYNVGSYLKSVAFVRDVVPGINITSDVIVGYPGEDEEAFQCSLEAVRQANITKVHTFSFSPRPGTEAEALGDLVSAQEKRSRSRGMRELSQELGRQFKTQKLGTVEPVLVDKRAGNRLSGYTPDYTRVYLDGAVAQPGEIVDAKLQELYADGIHASTL